MFSGGSEMEQARELLGDQGSFFARPGAVVDAPARRQVVAHGAGVRKVLVPAVYSGPTIGDIETALAMSGNIAAEPAGIDGIPRPAVAPPEKGFNKTENKYTLRIRCSGNGVADDGYKWRKYGQKTIKNSPNPRSYYRCTNPRCGAKKQVERSVEDPDTLVVTYEGLHLHYAYSPFLLPRPRDFSAAAAAASSPAAKRTKLEDTVPRGGPVAGPEKQTGSPAAHLHRRLEMFEEEEEVGQEQQEEPGRAAPQGLLEDIVPLLVRNPCSNISLDSTFYSVPSSPPSSSSSATSIWPHSSSFFEPGILSGTV